MAEPDLSAALRVMTAYLSAHGTYEEAMTRARGVADEHSMDDVVDSLVGLDAALVGMHYGRRAGQGRTKATDTAVMPLEVISRMSQTMLWSGIDVRVGVAVVTAQMSTPPDGERRRRFRRIDWKHVGELMDERERAAMGRARRVVDEHDADEVFDGLVGLAAALLALRYAEDGITGIETLEWIE